jgi:hypothetical protein
MATVYGQAGSFPALTGNGLSARQLSRAFDGGSLNEALCCEEGIPAGGFERRGNFIEDHLGNPPNVERVARQDDGQRLSSV